MTALIAKYNLNVVVLNRSQMLRSIGNSCTILLVANDRFSISSIVSWTPFAGISTFQPKRSRPYGC